MENITKLIHQSVKLLREHNFMLVAAESCTGGGLSDKLTAIPGCSQWFERGFVTYSNEAKIEMLGVPKTLLAKDGAVSEATAKAMVKGALKYSHGQIAIAVTGIAGPTGATPGKPVGTVWIAWGISIGSRPSVFTSMAPEKQFVHKAREQPSSAC